jgi:hypothetical protein
VSSNPSSGSGNSKHDIEQAFDGLSIKIKLISIGKDLGVLLEVHKAAQVITARH